MIDIALNWFNGNREVIWALPLVIVFSVIIVMGCAIVIKNYIKALKNVKKK